MIQLADSVEGAYEQRGDMYVKLLRDYERAIVEYDQAIERNPSGVTLRRKRATAFCENGHWSAAAADFAQAGQHDPDSALFPYWAALAQLGAGDAVGYGETCTALLQHFAQTGDPETARWVAWTCALAPDAVADLLLAVEFAEQAVAADPDNNMYRNTLGAILHRTGRHQKAADVLTELTEAWESGEEPIRSSPAYTWYLLIVDDELMDGDRPRNLVTAEAVNNQGQIVGVYAGDELASDGYAQWFAYRYTPPSYDEDGGLVNGRLENLIDVQNLIDVPEVEYMPIDGLNDHGDVLLRVIFEGGVHRTFLYIEDGAVSEAELKQAAGISEDHAFRAAGLNNRELDGDHSNVQLAGIVHEGDWPWAVRYTYDWHQGGVESGQGTITYIDPANSKVKYTTAAAVNDWGDVVGREVLENQNRRRAFLYTDEGGTEDLGTLGDREASAHDVNNARDVVGVSTTESKGSQSWRKVWEPFLYIDGTMHALREIVDGHEMFDTIRSLRINNRISADDELPGQIVATTAILTEEDGWVYGRILLTPYPIEQD